VVSAIKYGVILECRGGGILAQLGGYIIRAGDSEGLNLDSGLKKEKFTPFQESTFDFWATAN
jgi:hypothetical protein